MRSLSRALPSHLAPPFTKPHSHLLLTTPSFSTTVLSDHDLAALRHLLPALCDAGHHLHAIRLLHAALLSSPPLSSLPLPALADRLSSLPDISSSMALLTSLRFHPRRPSPLPFCALLMSSYFRRRRLREAAKIFARVCRPDFPCRPDAEIYGIVVRGFCEGGRGVEAVRVVREMVKDGIGLTEEIRVLVCLGLLREARVWEGLEFDDAARKAVEGGEEGMVGLKEMLDRMIGDWEE